MLYLLLAVVLGIGAVVYLIKKGKIKDSDGDLIPDAVEDKVENVKKTVTKVKKTAKELKAEFDVIASEVGDVIDEVKEVGDVIKKTAAKRRGRPKAKKGPSVKSNKK